MSDTHHFHSLLVQAFHQHVHRHVGRCRRQHLFARCHETTHGRHQGSRFPGSWRSMQQRQWSTRPHRSHRLLLFGVQSRKALVHLVLGRGCWPIARAQGSVSEGFGFFPVDVHPMAQRMGHGLVASFIGARIHCPRHVLNGHALGAISFEHDVHVHAAHLHDPCGPGAPFFDHFVVAHGSEQNRTSHPENSRQPSTFFALQGPLGSAKRVGRRCDLHRRPRQPFRTSNLQRRSRQQLGKVPSVMIALRQQRLRPLRQEVQWMHVAGHDRQSTMWKVPSNTNGPSPSYS